MKSFVTLTSLITLGLLSGCASTGGFSSANKFSQSDCQAPNWYAIGVADGKAGKYPHQIARYQKTCQGIDTPNREQWEQGRQDGLKSYCTKGNAYELGVRGLALNNVCADDVALELQQSHDLGYRQYYMRERLSYDNWYSPFYRPWFAPMPYGYW
ncbi:MAG: DUF2799 domain-containing protein [Moraxella sp.]|nr:DUF2799 domain-containing protein [Moraxella sp.]